MYNYAKFPVHGFRASLVQIDARRKFAPLGDFSLLSAGVFFRRRMLRHEIINHQLCWWSTILALAVYKKPP
ncbi:hypothetical protein, partial [Anaerostipes faecalis]|uniref:hypothetical protein n=1 Tax=Anaerostipes faecalis TaxID=2738446 RepID=UPI001C1E7B78